jgi:serine/threonine protein kinase
MFRDPLDDTFYTRSIRLLQNKEKSDNLATLLQRRIDHPNLYYVSPADFNLKTHKQFCSSFFRIEVFMPYPEEDLAKELKERQVENRPFSNKEITFLLYDAVNGLSHMQQLGFVHGNLGPEFIARTTTGYAIMEDPLLNQFRMILLREKLNWYLSPKAYKTALYGKPCGKDYNINKSDVFSAGLILLEASLHKSVKDIYDKKGLNPNLLKLHIA